MTDQTENVQTEVEVVSTSQALDALIKQFDAKCREMKSLVSEMRAFRKEVVGLERQLEKSKSKKKKKVSNGNPSGFAIARPISDELSDFLGLERGVAIARTEVTKLITTYIAEHNLKNPENKRNILLTGEHGEKLKSILSPLVDADGNEVELSYFNLQRYIKHHFPKASKTVTETVEEPVKTTKKKVVKKVVKKPVAATA